MPLSVNFPPRSGVELLKSHPADVYNKVDAISLEQLDKLAREPHSVVISCEMELK